MIRSLFQKVLTCYPELLTPYHLGTLGESLERDFIKYHVHAINSLGDSTVNGYKEIYECKLHRVIESARKTKFWKEKLGSADVTCLASFPLTFKKELQKTPISHRTNYRLVDRYGKLTITSGSTGEPLKFFVDTRLRTRQRAFLAKAMASHQLDPNLLVNIWPTKNPNPLFGTRFVDAHTLEQLYKKRLEIYSLINASGAIVHAFPSYLKAVIDFAEADGTSLRPSAVLLSGEALSAQEKQYLEMKLQCLVKIYYACRELSVIAWMCEAGRYHANNLDVVVEVVDEDSNLVVPGTIGKILVTGLNNHLSPFVRYFNGDYGICHSDPCPCGIDVKTFEVIGRGSDLESICIDCKDHVFPYTLSGIFNTRCEYIRQYQIIQKGVHNFLVYIVPTHRFTEKIRQDVHAALFEKLNQSSIIIKTTTEIRSNTTKVLPFIKEL